MTARAVQTRCLWFCDSMIGRSEQKCALPRAVAGQRSTVCPRVFQSVLQGGSPHTHGAHCLTPAKAQSPPWCGRMPHATCSAGI